MCWPIFWEAFCEAAEPSWGCASLKWKLLAAGHWPKTHFLNAIEDLIQHITNNNAEEQDHNNLFIFTPWSAGAAGAPAGFQFQSCFLFRLIQCSASPASPSLRKNGFIIHYTLQIEGGKNSSPVAFCTAQHHRRDFLRWSPHQEGCTNISVSFT